MTSPAPWKPAPHRMNPHRSVPEPARHLNLLLAVLPANRRGCRRAGCIEKYAQKRDSVMCQRRRSPLA